MPPSPGLTTSPAARALPLIEPIYAASRRPERWDAFLEQLSAELGNPAIMFNVELPREPTSATSYRIHSEDHFGAVFADLASRGEVPWPLAELARTPRFFWAEEFISNEELTKTEFYQAYMEPQGFAPEGPLGHVLAAADGRPIAALGIYRREGERPLTHLDAEVLDLLVPHLRGAYAIHCELRDSRQRRDVIAEAVDRFPMGVLLVDHDLRVVHLNRAAARICDQRDGISIVGGVASARARLIGGHLADITSQLEGTSKPGIARRVFSIERPSGRRPYEALVTVLSNSGSALWPGEPVAMVFIADPEDQQIRMPAVFSELYSLTPAETELASLLCAAHSIEAAAEARGISTHTARTQLKRIFSKTGVKRQVDLVRLLTAGISGLEGSTLDEDPARDARALEVSR